MIHIARVPYVTLRNVSLYQDGNESQSTIQGNFLVIMAAGHMATLTVEVVTIGDELNRGEIVDTNSSWLAERLTALGAHVRWRTSVTDEPGDIEAALATACGRAQIAVCSGGLGPT